MTLFASQVVALGGTRTDGRSLPSREMLGSTVMPGRLDSSLRFIDIKTLSLETLGFIAVCFSCDEMIMINSIERGTSHADRPRPARAACRSAPAVSTRGVQAQVEPTRAAWVAASIDELRPQRAHWHSATEMSRWAS